MLPSQPKQTVDCGRDTEYQRRKPETIDCSGERTPPVKFIRELHGRCSDGGKDGSDSGEIVEAPRVLLLHVPNGGDTLLRVVSVTRGLEAWNVDSLTDFDEHAERGCDTVDVVPHFLG